jgi:NAD(P)-dependent dehydrogenase (short-subunit alcohol dehydrogenase family)
MLLEGVTAAVWGEGEAIGAHIAGAFAAEGACVVEAGEGVDVLVALADDPRCGPALLAAARDVAPGMVARGWGAVLIVAVSARAAVDAPARLLAAELGPRGVRVICLRSAAGSGEAGPGRMAEHRAQVADLAALSTGLVAAGAATARTARA